MLSAEFQNVTEFKAWFEGHFGLGGKPYTLDLDQAKAVFDNHENTLVTARAGSGKTRVIVAKVAYLIARHLATLDEIAVFMFNRTAAAEVNERIGAVEIDGVPLKDFCHREKVQVASTFHKFALDIVKQSGVIPQIISETTHDNLIKSAALKVATSSKRKIAPQEYIELLRLANSFIARAGQKYLGATGLKDLCQDVEAYIAEHQADANYQARIEIHQFCLAVYQEYLLSLTSPQIDFNILMAQAIQTLGRPSQPLRAKIDRLRYIMVDEYQDFSYLFHSIIQAVRALAPAAHLFAVGDDWQAINRFAGSDVDYFLNFAQYFPEDVVNIPLVTNYRSDRKIVENANDYMLKNYNPKATQAVPFSKKSGKIKRQNLCKVKFDAQDLKEDALGDARYQLVLAEVCQLPPAKLTEAARMLKAVCKIVRRHRHEGILLLHRHNFTSFVGVSLENFYQSLQRMVVAENIMTAAEFAAQVRAMTMHKSKGLESDVVILLEMNRDQILATHPHATIFEIFGDNLAAEQADQQRLLYVALTRAKHHLYLLTSDQKCPV